MKDYTQFKFSELGSEVWTADRRLRGIVEAAWDLISSQQVLRLVK